MAYDELRPFQAYSAWNGIAVLSPTPFLPPFKVRFRRGAPGECAASECTLLAADFWKYGWGRIQVVPSVQVAYDRKTALVSARLLREKQSKLEWKNGVPPRHLDSAVRWIKEYVGTLGKRRADIHQSTTYGPLPPVARGKRPRGKCVEDDRVGQTLLAIVARQDEAPRGRNLTHTPRTAHIHKQHCMVLRTVIMDNHFWDQRRTVCLALARG